MPTEFIQLAVGYYESVNRRDFSFYDATFTEDVAFALVGGASGTGRDTIRFADQIWVRAASDFRIEGIYHLGDGNRVVCHNRALGTHDGILVMPDGSEVPPTGMTFNIPYFASFEIRRGQIASELIYIDRMELAEQLGLLDAAHA
jgi:ketosteroid isomerase-like protein